MSQLQQILTPNSINNLVSNVPLYILGLVSLILVLRHIKNLNVKLGNKEISFNTKNDIVKPILKVIVDYADWKSDMYKCYTEDFQSIDNDAKRLACVSIDSHIALLKQRYGYVISASSYPKKAELTDRFLKLFSEVIRKELMSLIMNIYEVNHLYDKTPEKIKELTAKHYHEIENTYRRLISEYWYKELLDVQGFLESCNNSRVLWEPLLEQIILDFKNLSTKKFNLDKAYSALDTEVRSTVIETGSLPVDAYTRLHDLYKGSY